MGPDSPKTKNTTLSAEDRADARDARSLTSGALSDLREFCRKNSLQISQQRPISRTGGLSLGARRPHLIRCNNYEQLKALRGFLARTCPNIRAQDIAGGREPNNQSFSIGKLWNGVDLLIQCSEAPSITQVPTEQETASTETIVRIPGNIMLTELNDKLNTQGLHSDALSGCLPFMSFAGGLSTQSHSSQGYLADLVQAVTVILPNGEEKTYHREKKDEKENFRRLVEGPSLGLCGSIKSLEIKVNQGRRKLQRTVKKPVPFDEFLNSLDHNGQGLTSSTLMMDHRCREVKQTVIEYVSDDEGHLEEANPFQAQNYIGPVTERLATAAANASIVKGLYHREFKQEVMSARDDRVEVGPVSKIMGPEKSVAARVTESGLIFNYTHIAVVQGFFKHLEKMLIEHPNAVNTAVFVRFPRQLGKEGAYDVCVDFASMGLDLNEMTPFIESLLEYFKNKPNMQPRMHWGKTGAVELNQQNSFINDTGKNIWQTVQTGAQAFLESECPGNAPLVSQQADQIRRLEQPGKFNRFLKDTSIEPGRTAKERALRKELRKIRTHVKTLAHLAPGIQKIDYLIDFYQEAKKILQSNEPAHRVDKLKDLQKTLQQKYPDITDQRNYLWKTKHSKTERLVRNFIHKLSARSAPGQEPGNN